MVVISESSGSTELINNFDAGNPLFLQSNDNSSVSIVNFKLIGAENYKMWTTTLKIIFEGKNKMGFIDDTYVKQESSVVLSQQWERCNAIVLGWILSEVNQYVPSTSGSLSASFTNKQMMKLLSLISENPSPNANMLDPTKDIFNVVNIYSLILTICHPNGTLAKNTAIGSLRLTSGIVLFDVLVVLEYNDLKLGKIVEATVAKIGLGGRLIGV
ncbi:ribonuclease H-like domain-containing protein [Tanacetum coccineum]